MSSMSRIKEYLCIGIRVVKESLLTEKKTRYERDKE